MADQDLDPLIIPVVADAQRFHQDMQRLERESRAAGQKSGAAFGEGAKDVGGFRAQVTGAATAMTGVLMVAADRASQGLRGLWGFVTRTTTGLMDLGATGALTVARGLRTMAEGTRDANGELSTMGRVGYVAANGLERVAKVVLTVSGLITGMQLAAAATAASIAVLSHRAAASFAPAWNRVRVSIGDSDGDFEKLRDQVSALAGDLGVDGVEAANTFYEILGSMPQLLEDPVRALEILTVSLEAGSTGFTEAATAAKATTAILTAFGLEAEEARRVSDALFMAQGLGATTYGEIADSIGQVSGLTAALGGDFEELLGIIATLTPTGISTSQVLTQVRAALTNIIKPSEQAREAAAELGIDFGAAALEAKGLNTFLTDLIEQTGGRADILSRLFGSDEALALLIGLVDKTEELHAITGKVIESAGAQAEAVGIANDSWEDQKRILGEQVSAELRRIGFLFDDVGTKGLQAANAVIRWWRGVRDEINASREALEAFAAEEARRGARPPEFDLPANVAQPPASRRSDPISRPLEPTSLEYSQAKIRDQAALLQLRAVADHAATQSAEAYEQASRRAQEQVNRLVLSEMERLRAAGVEEAQIAELASMYRVLSEQSSEAQRALEAALQRRTTVAEREISLLREEAQAAQQLGRVDLAAKWNSEADALERLNRWAAEFTPAIAGSVQAWSQEIGPAVGALTAEFNHRMAELEEQRARKIIDPEAFERLGREAAERFNQGVLAKIDALRAAGKLTREEYERLAGLLRDLGEIDDPAERARAVADTAREYANVGRAVLSVADAMGQLDDQTHRALEGVILLLENLAAIQGALKAGTAVSMGAVVGAIGGVAALVAAFSQAAEADRQARLRQVDSSYRLVRALDDLRHAVLTDISITEKESLEAVGRGFVERERAGLQWLLENMGGTTRIDPTRLQAGEWDFLQRLQELTDIDFLDEQTGAFQIEEFFAAWEKFLKMDIAAFGKDLEGKLDALDFAFRMGGDAIGDANAQMQLFLDTLRGIPEAAAFANEFERILAEEGEDAARAWLQQQAVLFATGGAGALSWAKDLSSDEIQRVLSAGTDALDRLAQSADRAASSVSNIPPLLDHALNRMRREAVFNAGGVGLPIPKPTDLGGQLPRGMRDALQSLRANPWTEANIQALIDQSSPTPIVEELVRLRTAFEHRPPEGDVSVSISIPREAVPAGGWNERELAHQIERVALEVLRDNKTAQRYVQRATRRPS